MIVIGICILVVASAALYWFVIRQPQNNTTQVQATNTAVNQTVQEDDNLFDDEDYLDEAVEELELIDAQ